MKIYYATSISGVQSEDSDEINSKLIEYLKNFGEVLTEHFANPAIKKNGEARIKDEDIHNRDMKWLLESDVIIAEVSNPSLGVGYELGRAFELNKKILCMCRKNIKRLSAMITGNGKMTVKYYSSVNEAKDIIRNYFLADKLSKITKRRM
ncbi:MAG: nucleoside 2-deoxyribosyltransferase [Ignavibacteria bacterium]|nr:nucleoside 2-deoxyribosyltransferase [Ignavibacteria bacterium]